MNNHTIFNIPLDAELPEDCQRIILGMGCFWGAERCLWKIKGVYRTAAGYAGGQDKNPNYTKVCTGQTGHAEVVEVLYKPDELPLIELLKVFWENHDPTQGMKQGNDLGSQYRSMLICDNDEQLKQANDSKVSYQQQLINEGHQTISTEIVSNVTFYLAEEEHQQYLEKNPEGYCGLGGTGTCFIN